MPTVRMYTRDWCGYCTAAKRYLAAKGIEVTEIDVTHDPETRAWLVETTGQRTVPQIFIGEQAIGGYTDLRALDASGGLEPLLKSA